MPILSIAFPVEAVLPFLDAFALGVLDMLGPLLMLALLAALGMVFKPLLTGLLRAGLLLIRPRRAARD